MRCMTSGFCHCVSAICIVWCIDVIMTVNIKIHSYILMMPCIVLDAYHSFTGTYYLHLQEKRDIVMA